MLDLNQLMIQNTHKQLLNTDQVTLLYLIMDSITALMVHNGNILLQILHQTD